MTIAHWDETIPAVNRVYTVTFELQELGLTSENNVAYINAYVRLPGFCTYFPDGLAQVSFQNGDLVGVDTCGFRNKHMLLSEKMEDARSQITEVIKLYIQKQN